MKAAYVFFAAVAALCTMACSNVGQGTEEDAVLVPVAEVQENAATVSLDSFCRNVVYTRPVPPAAPVFPGNKLFIRREKDSITFSGVVYRQASGDPKAPRQVYRFYFRSSAAGSYAYLKFSRYVSAGGQLQQLESREAAYHLKLGARPDAGA